MLLNIFQCIRQPYSRELFGQNVNSTRKLHKLLLIHSISHSTFSIHCTNLYLYFSCIFTFLEIIKHHLPKDSVFSPIFSIQMAAQKFKNFDKFFIMHADITAVTIQSNKIVLNEIKDNQALLGPPYRKKTNKLFD